MLLISFASFGQNTESVYVKPQGEKVQFYKVNNTGQNNLNSPANDVLWNAPSVNTIAGAIPLANGVTLPAGIYQFSVTMYYEVSPAGPQRANVAIQLDIGGVDQPELSASGYMRRASGHNEASTHLTAIYELPNSATVKVEGLQLSAGGVVNNPAGRSALSIIKLQ